MKEDSGWIKIHRKIRDWQHYGEPMVLVVFIDLLLSAKTENGWVHGVKVLRGQVLTSTARIMENTGIGSDNTVRRALKKLEESGEIIRKVTSNYSLITINKFDNYQCYAKYEQPTAQQSAEPIAQPSAQQGAYIKESNNISIITKNERIEESSSCLPKQQQQHPTLEQIREEVRVKGYTFDAMQYYAYYEANGWVLKDNRPMRNWRASMYAWQKRETKEKVGTNQSYHLPEQRKPAWDDSKCISIDEYNRLKANETK